jgi:CHAT domain-containing protein/tetratricopeptide (TPR) repeat protein
MHRVTRLLVALFTSAEVVCVSAAQTPTATRPTSDVVTSLLERGDYVEAEREARSWVRNAASRDGEDSLEFARASTQLVHALIRNGETGPPTTLTLAERAVKLTAKHSGLDSLDTAESLYHLGNLHIERGEYERALSVHQQALALRQKHLGPNASAVADSLDRIAATLTAIERFNVVEKTLERARLIRDARADAEPLALARTLELQAWLARNTAKYPASRTLLDQVLSIRRAHAPEHPEIAAAAKLQGDLLWLGGNQLAARDAWSGGLSLIARTLGSEHPAGITLRRRLALVTDRLGNRQEARILSARALQLAEPVFARCNPDLMGLRSDVADSLTYAGDYTTAQRLYRVALKSFEECLGVAHSGTATVVYNYALLLTEMGDLGEAERLYERTLRAWTARLGPNHPYVARALEGLAETAEARQEPARARQLYVRALAKRRTTDEDHPDIAWTLTNLGRVTAAAGDSVLARKYVEEAIQMFTRLGSSDEPDHFARVLALKGELDRREGNLVAARASFAESLSTRERMLGESHPLAAQSRAQLALVDFGLGSHDQALTEALDAERVGRDHLQFTGRYLPERQAMAYAAKRPKGLDLALSLAAAGVTSDHAAILDALVRSRGVILDELAARSRVAAAADSELAPRFAAAVQARQRFANLMVRSLQDSSSVPRAMLDEARQQKEEAERSLAEQNAEARAELSRAQTGFSEVLAALPAGSALVSFARYQRTRQAAPGSARPRTPVASYGAYVVRAGSTHAEFISIGTADYVEGLVRRWRLEAGGSSIAAGASAADADRAYRTAAVALRRAVWDPLATQLAGATRTFIVGDGALTLVNVAALPDATGKYLVEGDSVIHNLSTERDLVSLPGNSTRTTLLAVGGVAFGGRITAADASTSLRRAGCEGFRALQFEDLPATRREATEIGRAWSTHGPGTVTMLSGAAATETAVKRGLSGHRVVHLATHGFFLGADCTPAVQSTRGVGGLTTSATQARRSPTVDNPLLLAGLAFAGANRVRKPGANEDDGILTAEEIAALNLQGTEWAVLSACDTGLGAIAAGEGVLGLRRAFQVAGARTVIMSLWSVEDRAAMEWMRALYDGRLRGGLDTAAAVREASVTVLSQRRARRATIHPFYWAGFVASGEWR